VAAGYDAEAAGNISATRIALFEADPDLLRHLRPDDVARARTSLAAPLVSIPSGSFDPAALLVGGAHTFAALVVSGMLTYELTLGGQPTLVLMGAGELLHPWEERPVLLVAEDAWAASGPATIALLDDRFLQAVRAWPRILTGLVDRAAARDDNTLVQLAISQQPRVESRLVDLFRHLGGRWGRMTSAGVVVPLSLTHEALGRMIGARRPTVTLALKELAAAGRLRRRTDGAWVLLDTELIVPLLAPLKRAARPALVVTDDAPG